MSALLLCLALLLVSRPASTEQASRDGQDGLCPVRGSRFSPGESWIHDEECAQCTCTGHGISQCRPLSCQHPADCHAVTRASATNASCCPVCSDCASKSGASSVWEEDECTTCRCVGGRKRCQTAACRLNCLQPVRVAGICCPICPNAENPLQHSTKQEGVPFVLAGLLVASLACVALGAGCLWKRTHLRRCSERNLGLKASDTTLELSPP